VLRCGSDCWPFIVGTATSLNTLALSGGSGIFGGQLSGIVKMDLLQNETATDIQRMWAMHHDQKGTYVAGAFTAPMYRTLQKRLAECPQVRLADVATPFGGGAEH